jgi:hypothetical protein
MTDIVTYGISAADRILRRDARNAAGEGLIEREPALTWKDHCVARYEVASYVVIVATLEQHVPACRSRDRSSQLRQVGSVSHYHACHRYAALAQKTDSIHEQVQPLTPLNCPNKQGREVILADSEAVPHRVSSWLKIGRLPPNAAGVNGIGGKEYAVVRYAGGKEVANGHLVEADTGR